MLSTGNNGSRGGGTLSSDMPPLPQCLPLEPITLSNQKYTRSGELRRVLGVPLGNSSEDHSFGVTHPKPPPPVATEELKHFKESVQDTSKKARDRAKKLRESIFKLDKYNEALSSKKRQRSDMSSAERSCGVNLVKMGSQLHRNPHDVMTQRLEERTKGVGLSKRIRTSVADVRADSRAAAAASRQQMATDKDMDMLLANSGGSVRIEEKVRRLPAGGEGWETKMKRKRSVAAVSNRVINGDRDIKHAMQPKLSIDSKLRSCDSQSLRSKSSPGVIGINKLDGSFEPSNSDASVVLRNESEGTPLPKDRMALVEQRVLAKANHKSNFQDDNQANCSSTILKGKISRAPRTGSIMVLDTSSKAQPSSGACQGWEQPTNVNKVPALGVANHQKRQIASSSSHAMAQWVGQRPHKNSRTRRANLVSPVSNNVDTHNSPQGFATSDFGGRASYRNGGLLLASADNNAPKIRREVENVSSPFGLSESEESGAGDSKTKEIGIDGGEVSASNKMGPLILPMRKNKVFINENGDTVRRQGRSGNGSSSTRPSVNPVRDKLENLQMLKPLQGTRPLSDKNKSKSGRPPSKKLKVFKSTTRVGPIVNSVSSDFTGESDDDHEELFAAANYARKARSLACSGLFWKKMESIFVSVSSEDVSYLKQQLSFAEELDDGLSQMFGVGCNVMGVVVKKESADCSVEEQISHSNPDSAKTNALCERFDVRRSQRATPLYQRVLSALIEEDETEELFHHREGKNMSLHYASDDSHCGSCNQIDVEPKDKDRMESEVESNADFQSQKNCVLDRLSCDRSIGSNSFRNASLSNSVHSSELWLGDDDMSHLDVGLVSEICSNDLGHLQSRETNHNGLSLSDSQYQLMCLDDRLLLELASIGLYPETLPDLAEGEIINHDVMELKEGLYKQVQRKKKNLGRIDTAIQKSSDMEKRNLEHLAMDQLVEMAYRKRMACRGSNASKAWKVSRQVALAFIKRTLARCRKFEETGSSCFSEPALQDVMYSAPPCSNDAKSVECVGSGTASNTCNEASNNQAEARVSAGAVSSAKRREVLIDDVVGSASSRVTSSLDSPMLGVRGKRSEREREQNKNGLRCNLVSGSGRISLDSTFKSERKTKAKPKQRNNNLFTQAAGLSTFGSDQSTVVNASSLTGKARSSPAEEADDSIDFANLQLPEFSSMDEVGVTNGLGGHQDLSNWLNFDEDGLQDHDSMGLEIPMDDLSELNMLM